MPIAAPSHSVAGTQNREHKFATPSETYKHLYGRRWKAARLIYLSANPLCVRCQARGDVKAADIVDHIVPHKGDIALFWDRSNWQSLCKRDHDIKTATEDGGFGNGEGGSKV